MRPVCLASCGIKALETWRTTFSRQWKGFHSLFRLFFSGMMKRRLHLEVIIRYSSSYPRFGGATSVGAGRVELCAQRTSRDLVGFCVILYGLSSLLMVVALVC
jgi:hypothetical protein